jgi:hypothetical protein
VLWLIPTFGTWRTFLIFGVALMLCAIIGLIAFRYSKRATPDDTPEGQPPTRKRGLDKSLLSLLLLVPMLLTPLGMQGVIKPPSGTNGGGKLLTERESFFNYIQVVQVGNERQLILNEGLGVHSIYNPDSVITEGPWDYFLVAPYFNSAPFSANQVRKVCVIGLGAGTIPRELNAAYPDNQLSIDGVEIDSEIVNMAQKYFKMDEPNLNVVVQDGRYFLQTSPSKYDIIGIDAYQQPYVPFQLTTREFFQEVRSHLTPTGVAVINAGRTSDDFRLVDALAQTMRSTFSNVYIIDSKRFSNSLIIGTNASTQLGNFAANTAQLSNPLLQTIASNSINFGNIREEKRNTVYFTDDRAPVEQLIDMIIFNTVQKEQ